MVHLGVRGRGGESGHEEVAREPGDGRGGLRVVPVVAVGDAPEGALRVALKGALGHGLRFRRMGLEPRFAR